MGVPGWPDLCEVFVSDPVATTLDVYSHVLQNMQQEVADKLNSILYAGRAKGHVGSLKN